MFRIVFALNCLFCLLDPTAASAWGYQGHKVVGSIADHLLNANAKQQVKHILGYDLRTAAPWPDCVKSVVRHDDGSFHYEVDPNHLEFEVPCVPFNSVEERARMMDYAKRNWFTCSYTPDGFERGCHNTFHFEDIALQRDSFDRNLQGTNDHDLVAAIGAAIAVLSSKRAPSCFSIKDKKEALFMLVHFVGDLHQPLHVGSVYLDADGKLADPDTAHKADPATETIGGNALDDQNIIDGREPCHVQISPIRIRYIMEYLYLGEYQALAPKCCAFKLIGDAFQRATARFRHPGTTSRAGSA
jgi:hypothetical protein